MGHLTSNIRREAHLLSSADGNGPAPPLSLEPARGRAWSLCTPALPDPCALLCNLGLLLHFSGWLTCCLFPSSFLTLSLTDIPGPVRGWRHPAWAVHLPPCSK